MGQASEALFHAPLQVQTLTIVPEWHESTITMTFTPGLNPSHHVANSSSISKLS